MFKSKKYRSIGLLLTVLCVSSSLLGQYTAEQYVFSSVGIEQTTPSGIHVSGTVGEAIISTLRGTNFILTQGFHQPSILAAQPLALSVDTFDASCYNSSDGYAVVHILGGRFPYSYVWSEGGGGSDTSLGYKPGFYSIIVTDANGSVGVLDFNIGSKFSENCELTIYSGLTPNGDGINDFWIIDGIEKAGDNDVQIYDRWGGKVWEGTNYDNITVVWNGFRQDGKTLPTGTYFYIVNVPNKNLYKGWIHLTK